MAEILFTSDRLSFRNWNENDLDSFAKMNSDERVMKHFPTLLSAEETQAFVERLLLHFEKYSYTYFAVNTLINNEFIGFIGLANQDYKAEFNPAVDIGWRLKPTAWNKGYATEGAKRCLEYGFNELGLEKIIATCTYNNTESENVMQKIGMQFKGAFLHPKLTEHPNYQRCKWYEIKKEKSN